MRRLLLPLAALALLSAATLAAANLDSSQYSLADWAHKALSGSTSSSSSSGGTSARLASAKTAGTCSKRTKTLGCYRMASSCGEHYPLTFRSSLACCQDEHQEVDQMLSTSIAGISSVSVGQCFMSRGEKFYQLSPAVEMGENYLITCNLNEKASACGPSGCDDLVLTSQGPTYLLTTVIADTQPIEPSSTDCPGLPAERQQKPSKLSTTAHAQRRLDGDLHVWQTQSLVFSGPMQVTSKAYESTRYREGWFTLTLPTGNGTWVPLAKVEAEEVDQGRRFPRVKAADFYKYELEFFRSPPEQQQGGRQYKLYL